MNEIKLEMKDISIEFPGVKALNGVDFSLTSGSIHALVGANGAGKSTLMKVLAGVNTHYTGQISVGGEPVEIRCPKDAKNLGIEIVFQEVDTALIPYLTVAENVMFNTLVNKMGKKQVVHWKEIKRAAKAVLEKLNVAVDINKPVSALTLAQKQMVLIARCVVEKCRFLILDEPTAPLSNSETLELFRVVRELAKENVGVVFISHRLSELYEICESITIMRDGMLVTNLPLTKELEVNTLVEYMLGRCYEDNYIKKACKIGEPLLEIEDLTEKEGKVKNITITVREGEIVGVAGLVGAGKTELCKTLFSAYQLKSGTMKLRGKVIRAKGPTQAVKNGLALVPEERRKEGVLISDTVVSNISVAAMEKYTNKLSVVNKKREKEDARSMIRDLGIKTPSENQVVSLLSGGNQQKVVVGKWLNKDSEVYIFDEPTKGIDVGAKQDMYELIEGLAAKGKGIIYATCEFQEILSICDRIYVMYDGEIIRELTAADTDEKELLYYSTGGK
ncbi:monosaccharide ABC transporter ATP-binding protein (CUT2 family) [Lacrimispora xylanisolvens]|uniref:Monosaccharide ABC transporter ATP-binding protein (CUT2 family) n=1 Tax=Lacrimispora xylanisolvens TaxID=384636 RepID=A0A2S6HLV9_9FIRM|nr:sugar ABC transporter ATP-binding protein [Hungatella xylanolytica]MBE5989824.1 sugar ABC transporter ATP-binding protein [Paenibacillaceae bacterium]PPK78446.1 monosaccharide ABC transporter ATP-binding protein (CUT2 family) [Hungatella xylanolytica]